MRGRVRFRECEVRRGVWAVQRATGEKAVRIEFNTAGGFTIYSNPQPAPTAKPDATTHPQGNPPSLEAGPEIVL
jgi:hypothetical protein